MNLRGDRVPRLVIQPARGHRVLVRSGPVHPGELDPVPGGVGPLTIAMLMSNTIKAARLRRGSRAPASAPAAAAVPR